MEYSEAEKMMIMEGVKEPYLFVSFSIADALLRGAQAYRAMYEGLEKKLMRYRDVSGAPDIHIPERNKDAYNNLSDAERGYDAYIESMMLRREPTLPFDEWLFAKRDDKKEDV